jgi:hypothetical protein
MQKLDYVVPGRGWNYVVLGKGWNYVVLVFASGIGPGFIPDIKLAINFGL